MSLEQLIRVHVDDVQRFVYKSMYSHVHFKRMRTYSSLQCAVHALQRREENALPPLFFSLPCCTHKGAHFLAQAHQALSVRQGICIMSGPAKWPLEGRRRNGQKGMQQMQLVLRAR